MTDYTPMFAAWWYRSGRRSKTHWFRAETGAPACGAHVPLQQGHPLYIPDTPLLECLTCQRINERVNWEIGYEQERSAREAYDDHVRKGLFR
jgi:hypothetical protein